MNYARRIWGYILELIFPPLCLNCGVYISGVSYNNRLLCKDCIGLIPVYETVFYSPKLTLIAISSYESEPLRKLLHSFKYEGFLGAKEIVGGLIEKYMAEVDLKDILPKNLVIVPVPLYKARLRRRGFNQSEVIAKVLSEKINAPVENGVLIRTKDTPQQMNIRSKSARKENVKGCFGVKKKNSLKGVSVVIVDDVYTSGATMQEAARTLKRAGAKDVIGFVLARAL
jgi:competence protein ComFC